MAVVTGTSAYTYTPKPSRPRPLDSTLISRVSVHFRYSWECILPSKSSVTMYEVFLPLWTSLAPGSPRYPDSPLNLVAFSGLACLSLGMLRRGADCVVR